MQIIPNMPYATSSQAEGEVFYKLQNCFNSKEAKDNIVAYHSINLSSLAKDCFKEADFVVLSRYGLFVLEVKGGGVFIKNDEYYTKDKNQEILHIQNPFRQAKAALFAILQAIKDNKKTAHIKLSTGFGIVCPQSDIYVDTIEWCKTTLCNNRDFIDFEVWLRNLMNYWRKKEGNNAVISDEDFKLLQDYFRPEFESIEPLFASISRLASRAIKLSKEQFHYFDAMLSHPRIICSGGAGTGKTLLALELAKRLSYKKENIGFVCKSAWLKNYLQDQVKSEFVHFCLIEHLEQSMKRAFISSFDYLIVDEGQDLFNEHDLNLLDNALKGGLKEGKWYIFHDSNNQANIFDDMQMQAFRNLLLIDCGKINLKLNCRNTKQIINCVQENLGLDMGARGTGDGVEVRFAKRLQDEIKYLLDNGVNPGDIVILSPFDFGSSSANVLDKSSIICIDEYSTKFMPFDKISFCNIRDYKGLESEIAILIDLPLPNKNIEKKVNHYVGMSRAKAVLSIVYSDNIN